MMTQLNRLLNKRVRPKPAKEVPVAPPPRPPDEIPPHLLKVAETGNYRIETFYGREQALVDGRVVTCPAFMAFLKNRRRRP